MKMTSDHYDDLKQRVSSLVEKIEPHLQLLKKDPKVKDLEARLIWDVYHATKIANAYSYQEFNYKDTHIETAMRSIFRELGVSIANNDAALKASVLASAFSRDAVTPLSGFSILTAKLDQSGIGIFVKSGGFSREDFKKSIEEATAAGLCTSRMMVFSEYCTYSGPSILFEKIEDLNLPTLPPMAVVANIAPARPRPGR